MTIPIPPNINLLNATKLLHKDGEVYETIETLRIKDFNEAEPYLYQIVRVKNQKGHITQDLLKNFELIV